jgi:hypothetical protein
MGKNFILLFHCYFTKTLFQNPLFTSNLYYRLWKERLIIRRTVSIKQVIFISFNFSWIKIFFLLVKNGFLSLVFKGTFVWSSSQAPCIVPCDDPGSSKVTLKLACDDSTLHRCPGLRCVQCKKSFEMYFFVKSFQGRDEDANLSLVFHCKFSMVEMLEWREREKKEED